MWATCKKCGLQMQVIPSRLKSHYDECANKELELANANVSDD